MQIFHGRGGAVGRGGGSSFAAIRAQARGTVRGRIRIAPEVFFHCADTPISSITLVMRLNGDPSPLRPRSGTRFRRLIRRRRSTTSRRSRKYCPDSIAPRRFNLLLLGTFALVALMLAALGLYGVVAYAVSERTHEFGIRMALGAERPNVVRMMVAQGMWSVVAGLVVGLFGAWGATRLMAEANGPAARRGAAARSCIIAVPTR